MRVAIKVCGITNYEDARVGISLGVDAFGFIFIEKNPRFIDPIDAFNIIQKLPPFITKVGVFANDPVEKIDKYVKISGVNTIQLNGNEPPDFVNVFRIPVIKAFNIDKFFNLSILDEYRVSAFLLNTWGSFEGKYDNRRFSWNIAKKAVQNKKTIILAGQLGLANIREALDDIQPYAVDVNSSVEIKPGVKNPHKMGTVIKIVREWH
jgi:phosphoribosylanthranilate isomerase